MKSIIVMMLMTATLLIAGTTFAGEMPPLAKKHFCSTCHSIDKKIVGPAWADVAKKYKGDSTAEAKLLVKVSKGGSGVWGVTTMPANDPNDTKQADIKELIKFILAL